MKTRRLISTITYNTDMWLGANMPRWVQQGICDWAHWIRHEPEADEKKSHVHLLVQPSKAVDTSELIKLTYELDTQNEGKLLCCQPWRFSKLSDWLLYGLHDAGYLASKGQVRGFHYRLSDVCSTCPELVQDQYREIDLRSYGLGSVLAERIKAGDSWERVIASGVIPPPQFRYWKEVFFAMGGFGASRGDWRP